ncbi:MAG: hypothetical protein QGF47_13820, partial [Arenicellales bacterium]|nr:hypothetical protein [Arenicellales bacterium]
TGYCRHRHLLVPRRRKSKISSFWNQQLYGKPVNYPTIPLVQVVKPLDRRLRNFTVFQFGNRARQMIRIEKKPTPKDAKDLQSLASMLAPQF